MTYRFFTLSLLAFFALHATAQDSLKTLTFSGYIEAYYSYDFSEPANGDRPATFYNFNRHNEFNLNLGYLKAAYASSKVRGNLALMTGTYAQYNLAAEPTIIRNIYEANVGIKLSSRHNLWLDAGILPSHIGFESAVGKDCWALTRSLVAENSPYYEAGAKLTYTTPSEKLLVSAMALNGWQRIRRVEGNNTPAFGTQLVLKPSDRLTLNYSTFVGNDKPSTAKQWRHFHNLYGIFQCTPKTGLTVGFDLGFEQARPESDTWNTWYAPVVIVRQQLSDQWRLALRGEYYDDRHGVIVSTGTPNNFQTFGYSVNIDYLPTDNAVLRLEARGLSAGDAIFSDINGTATQGNFFVTASAAISF